MVWKQPNTKQRIRIIIIAISLAVFVLCVTTKVVYDSVFDRYDGSVSVPSQLTQMVNGGEVKRYDSGDNQLCGYLYRSDGTRSTGVLVVMVTGMNTRSEDYLWQIQSLLQYGHSVFIFDATGTGNSQGKSAVGFSQIVIDTENTISYIEKNQSFGYNNIVLLGHSRGGYAACCALRSHNNITAVISISGINSAMEGVVGSAARYVGGLAYSNYLPLWLYQTHLFGGELVGLQAKDQLTQTKVPVLVVHGQNDQQVPVDKYSVYSYKDTIQNECVEFYLCTNGGQDGHTNLMFEQDGTANERLMEKIDRFLTKSME